MPLTPEQIAEMDAAFGYNAQQPMDKRTIEQMDIISGKAPRKTRWEDLVAALQSTDKAKKYANEAIQGGWEGVKEGSTFGFGDELQAAIAAGNVGIQNALGVNTGGLTAGPAYNQALTQLRQEKQAEQTAAPVASLSGNIAGGLTTGSLFGLGAAPTSLGKAAAQGATAGGAYGFGSGEGGVANRALEAVKGAAVGGALGGAGYGLTRIPDAIHAIRYKSVIPNSDQVRKMSSAMYEEAAQKGGVLTPKFADDFIYELQKMEPQTAQGKALAGADSPVTKVIQRLSGTVDDNGVVQGGITGKPITLDAAQEMDEVLSDMIDGYVKDGKLSKEGMKMLDIQTKFRDMINKADETQILGGKEGFDALKQARKLWATSRQMSDIDRIIQRTELSEQPATAIKSGFRTMLSNPNRMRGYSPEVKKAIKDAATTGAVTDLIRTAGSRLIPIITASTGGGLGSTAASAAASMAAREAASRVQLSKAAKIGQEIARQSGLLKEVKRF